jgi:hypothetical protein
VEQAVARPASTSPVASRRIWRMARS